MLDPLNRVYGSRALRAIGAPTLGLALALLVTACGSNAAAQTAPTAAPASSADPTGSAQAFTVTMNDANQFVPASLTVPRGATVTWQNIGQDAVPHTSTDDPTLAITPADTVLPDGAQAWTSDALGPGQTFVHTFDVPGNYRYFCRYHEALGMVGTLTVTD